MFILNLNYAIVSKKLFVNRVDPKLFMISLKMIIKKVSDVQGDKAIIC